ncbi:MAG: dipeptidyl aminopeptidase, partial [Pseudonocardia sp.]|nr:dipeptidyl aminopeptidase [Pseudonocardia sp.]
MFDDVLLDGQLLRTVGAAPYGGADIGECLATARRVQGTDLDSWYAEWTAL